MRTKTTISKKDYFCPACGNIEPHETNHTGEIYCSCKKCGNYVLYCKDAPKRKPEKTCKIAFYYFDLDLDKNTYEESRKAYKELKEGLRQKGYGMFNVYIEHSAIKALREHHNETIDLYDVDQFDNQITSSIGRVFYWFEALYPNRRIKEGYYLVFEEATE